MSTLLIDNKTLQLAQQGQCVVIRQPGKPARSLPFRLLKRVVISSNITIETRLLRSLAQQGIGVLIINPRKPTICPFAGRNTQRCLVPHPANERQ